MIENGERELRALARIDTISNSLLGCDQEAVLPATAEMAALAIDWLGFVELVKMPEFRDTLRKLGEPRPGETAPMYVGRIWPLLEDHEKGIALDCGLQKMVAMRRVAEAGVQLRVWRAYCNHEWVFSPSAPDTFDEWVRNVLTDAHSSSTEASFLWRLCVIVEWLMHHPIPGVELPPDPDMCFHRPHYRRWRAMVGKLWSHIAALEEKAVAEPTSETEEDITEIQEDIAELVQHIQDDTISTKGLDTIGSRYREPTPLPLVIEQSAYNPASGLIEITGHATKAQLVALRQKAGSLLDLRLKGEEYGVKKSRLVEYRLRDKREDVHCRTWIEANGTWSKWEIVDSFVQADQTQQLNGITHDPELGLTYLRYLEREK